MHRRHALWILMLCLAPLLAACGHPWKTSRQAVPNPFYGKGRFGVVPVTFHALEVGDVTEADWMAEKDDEQRLSWQEDKAAINEQFTEALMAQAASDDVIVVMATSAADAPFFIRSNVTFYEPGIFTGVFNMATVLKATVQITDPAGRVLDEVLLETATPASLYNPSSGGRARVAASQLGRLTAMYLLHRARGED
ncbi:hypothetical protein SOCEGT47_006170 [Sorangium cellulosum]|uniref:Lipoprotein n=1 Tax=Sorangium cellulosum TaxID=56 RepID=A0A4P2PUT2_SORCE|nr:hypothetical protein [Sorangium cellulosum]AUX20153.1 hypothetical protein SOCEGT47_006170 [Sorangium cellulosum]